MAREKNRIGRLGGLRLAAFAAGLVVLPGMAAAQAPTTRPSGRGLVYGGGLGGGRLSFPGAGDRALALSPVVGQQSIGYGGTVDVRDAVVVAAGESVPAAELVVPFPDSEGAGGLWMHAGYAFNRRVALLLQVGVASSASSAAFNQATGAFVVRFWPASRLWLEAGPAFGDLGYGYEDSVVRSGAVKGSGFHGSAGVSVLRRAKWSLDLEARFNSIGYEGFRANTATFAIGASRLPL
jgi:hypothetical protein